METAMGDPNWRPLGTPQSVIDSLDLNYGLPAWVVGEEYTCTIFFRPTNTDSAIYINLKHVSYNQAGNPMSEYAFATTLPDSIMVPSGKDSTLNLTFKVVDIDTRSYVNDIYAESWDLSTGTYVSGAVFSYQFQDNLYAIWSVRYPLKYTLKYHPATVNYKPTLNINVEDGGGNLLISLDGGLTWQGVDDKITPAQINNLTPGDLIWVKDAGNKYLKSIVFGEDQPTQGFLRPVTIPNLDNASISVGAGTHYVSSQSNYCFTVTPNEAQSGKDLVVTTNRTTIPDSEGVSVTKKQDGSYGVCILQVQSPVDLKFNFVTSNDCLENNSVWSNNGQLYISTLNTGVAKVYNVTGALVKSIPLAAGETGSTSLSPGIYVVLLNGQPTKVIVR